MNDGDPGPAEPPRSRTQAPGSRVPPHDLLAETGVLSSVLVSVRAMEDAGRLLEASDFYQPAHGHIWQAAVDLYADGLPIDAHTVGARLADRGLIGAIGGPQRIIDLLGDTSARIGHAPEYAARVIEMRTRREAIGAAMALADALYSGAETGAAVEEATDRLAHLGGADLTRPIEDIVAFEDWLRTEDTASRWVIPGLMRSDWRLMITAPPGTGKTTLTRQIAYAASVGVHPFTGDIIPPARTLLIDLENPVSAVRYTGDMMLAQGGVGGRILRPQDWDGGAGCMVWSRQAGINVLDRRDRMDFERRIAHVRPDMVVLGPVYKSFRKDSKRQSDEITEEVCAIFDDLRTRYDFALVLEHHSPRGSAELFPFGSSVWERWPEFGKTLRPDEKNSRRLIFGQFREDRVDVRWPLAFGRSREWPFKAEWTKEERSEPTPTYTGGDF